MKKALPCVGQEQLQVNQISSKIPRKLTKFLKNLIKFSPSWNCGKSLTISDFEVSIWNTIFTVQSLIITADCNFWGDFLSMIKLQLKSSSRYRADIVLSQIQNRLSKSMTHSRRYHVFLALISAWSLTSIGNLDNRKGHSLKKWCNSRQKPHRKKFKILQRYFRYFQLRR